MKFSVYLEEYAKNLKAEFKFHVPMLRFRGISMCGAVPSDPPPRSNGHPTWGISYDPSRVIQGVEFPWAVWAFVPKTPQGVLVREVMYLEYDDNPKKEAVIFCERVRILCTGTIVKAECFASLEEPLDTWDEEGLIEWK